MQKFQDTATGKEWHFDNGVDVAALQAAGSAPATLSAVIVARPSAAHTWANGKWVVDNLAAWADLKAQALAALEKSDMCALRCYKAGVAFPAAWQTYTTTLRGIVAAQTGTPGVLPVAPAYPAGT